MNKPIMILLVGPTGCGKSTFRKKYLAQFPCISPDDFIIGRWDSNKAFLAWSHAEKMADLLCRERKSFLVDAQFITPDSRNKWTKIARGHGLGIVAICFKTPWDQILANHKKRGNRNGYGKIPLDVIRTSHEKFTKSMSGPSNWFLFDAVMTINWGSRKDRECLIKALS
jgi:predicted kinase